MVFRTLLLTSLVTVFVLISTPRTAAACGCFAAPSPAFPMVQAGEKILFAQEGTKVIAHIQIQYEGEAEDFSWLIPVPEVPELRLSAEEVFAQLEATTDPGFVLAQTGGNCASGFGCGGSDAAAEVNTSGEAPFGKEVVVVQSTAGPYEYAVVRADSKTPMLDWLQTNGYLVPAGGEDLLDPYIRPGSFFLALKLRSGQTAGDLQPIVIEYEADLPMIPLILTRLGAVPDMGVLVWLLGDARAISTNYRHVQINEEYIDWVNGASNYAEVVARAIDEAENGHAFVTEYAGANNVVNRLDFPSRFGVRTEYEAILDASQYVRQLAVDQYPLDALRPVFERFFPLSDEAIAAGLTPDQYYLDLEISLSRYGFGAESFDPVALTDEIWTRVVEPTLEAGALFRRHQYLTRLYTAISPEEMTVDPVFAFNPDLPPINNIRTATLNQQCEPDDIKTPFQMNLTDGRQYYIATPQAWSARSTDGAPRAAIIENMRMEGQPIIEVDNRDQIATQPRLPNTASSCSSGGRQRWSNMLNLAFIFGSVLLLRWRLRR